ncbi:Phosphoinositide phospholipase C [Fusarium sp. LHS14.1]|nr:Phosphoinositide phospholipase C [Fusarium sp. LHS14.1]
MDLLDLTAAELSQKCLDLFDRCLASRSQAQDDGTAPPSQEQAEAPSIDERLEYKLADFNLWIDCIGALASARASLDWRLNERPIDLELVKGNLVMLYQSLEDYRDLQEKHQSLEETLLGIESALGSLASLALAVRRTGKRSRLHKADRLFNEEEHSELKQHLECIVVLRPGERGYNSHRFKQKLKALTPVQQRLVVANLRRRNRFLQARRHSTGLKRRKPDLSSISEDAVNQSYQPVASPDLDIPIPTHPVVEQPPKLPKNSDAPTISETSASVPESKLRYTDPGLRKPEASTPRTEVTRITATAHYPRPQLPDNSQHMFQCPCCYQTLPVQDVKTNSRWRKHLSEDICPYTCVVEDCPTPDVYYSTRTALERHIRQDHSPTWQCPLCSDEPHFASMTDTMAHFMALHPDAAEEDDISTLISLSTQRKTGIEACPLCDVEGIVDSPELIDHVLEHVHDFSLRSLPWPRSSHINLGGEVGTFDLGHSKCPSVIQWLGGVAEEGGHQRAQLSQFNHNRVAIVESQEPPYSDYDLPDEICFADEHGDGSAAAETDISRLTQETLSSSEMTNNIDDLPQDPDSTPIEQQSYKWERVPVPESTTSRFRNRIRKVFNLGTTKPVSNDAPKPAAPQQDLKGNNYPPPAYRAAVDLFNRLKDQGETLSLNAFNEFVRFQRPSGHEYDEVFSIKDGYRFARFYQAWVDLGISAKGPLPPKDLSWPLTNYFTSSSHNTYLIGNQLSTKASAEAYREILLQGCRYVEIDVWNGDSLTPDAQDSSRNHQSDTSTSSVRRKRKEQPPVELGEPIVTHGWDLTAPCGFRDVCAVIGTSAFVNNDLPIIVSLGVHADTEQQETMVRIMKEEWGELLLDEPLEGCDPRFRLPTLGDLRRKILVKAKKSPTLLSDSENSMRFLRPPSPEVKPSRIDICQALSNLAIYTHSEAFYGLDTPAAKRPSHVFSLSEGKLLELNEEDEAGLFRHNKHYFMRCFPSGRRIDSSNPDPSLFWRMGVQMVALSWHSLDEGMMLHHGMFANEDGWVLKPPDYRSTDKTVDTQPDAVRTGFRDIVITVLSGFDIPDAADDEEYHIRRDKSFLRPQVKVEIHFAQDKSDETVYTVKTETGTTKDPKFGAGGSRASFRTKWTLPQLTFVRFKVIDDQRSLLAPPLLGWACIRLDRLRQGYRLIELLDARGRVASGRLLVHIFVGP